MKRQYVICNGYLDRRHFWALLNFNPLYQWKSKTIFLTIESDEVRRTSAYFLGLL